MTATVPPSVAVGAGVTHRRRILPGTPAPHFFVEAAAEIFDVTVEELRSHQRWHPLVDYRWWTYLAIKISGYTQVEVGEALNRDHSTIHHALQEMDQDDPQIQKAIEEIRDLAEVLEEAL